LLADKKFRRHYLMCWRCQQLCLAHTGLGKAGEANPGCGDVGRIGATVNDGHAATLTSAGREN